MRAKYRPSMYIHSIVNLNAHLVTDTEGTVQVGSIVVVLAVLHLGGGNSQEPEILD